MQKNLGQMSAHIYDKENKQKTLQNVGLEGNSLNLIRDVYDKPTANIFTGEELKACPLRSATRQG